MEEEAITFEKYWYAKLVERTLAWLESLGFGAELSVYVAESAEILLVVGLAFLADLVAKRTVVRLLGRLDEKTRTDLGYIFVCRKVFLRLSSIAPAVVVYTMSPVVFQISTLVTFSRVASQVYMLWVSLLVVYAALSAAEDIYRTFDVSKRISIRGYLQVVKLIFSLAALIFAVSLIVDKSPLLLLSGLGAMTAILLLIFRDTILGLVAGIQLVAHDMLRPGDWIEMPSQGIEGDVEEVALNVVKIRSFDMTVATVPTYAFITQPFKNWRGMFQSGGRRIKRSILLDVSSIKFCTPALLQRLARMEGIGGYLEKRMSQALVGGSEGESARRPIRRPRIRGWRIGASLATGRNLSNSSVFRAYVVAFLREREDIHKNMTFLVRQLAPGPQGLPLEIYVFSNNQTWVEYEDIQSDIFDHLFAVLPLFELRPFQYLGLPKPHKSVF